jgi:hypothetical protein
MRKRRNAVAAMRLLAEFNPRLVGSVLDGTADQHARIALHVFADSPEDVVLYFLEQGRSFTQEQRQIRWFDGKHRIIPLIIFELDDTIVELSVFEPLHLRQAPPSPIDGKPQQRATLMEAECLLSDAEKTGGGIGQPTPATV